MVGGRRRRKLSVFCLYCLFSTACVSSSDSVGGGDSEQPSCKTVEYDLGKVQEGALPRGQGTAGLDKWNADARYRMTTARRARGRTGPEANRAGETADGRYVLGTWTDASQKKGRKDLEFSVVYDLEDVESRYPSERDDSDSGGQRRRATEEQQTGRETSSCRGEGKPKGSK